MELLILDLISRWLHILAGAVLAGGLLFWCCVLTPARFGNGDFDRLFTAIRPRWSLVVVLCTVVLLATGLLNAVRNIVRYDFAQAGYHSLVLVKLLLGLAVFGLAAILAGRSRLAERLRGQFARWSTLAAVLAVVVILLGGWMKSMDRTPKGLSTTAVASTVQR